MEKQMFQQEMNKKANVDLIKLIKLVSNLNV